MSNISIKINLLKYNGAKKIEKSSMGEGVFIPYEGNKFYISDVGVYSDLNAFDHTKDGSKDTHLVAIKGTKDEKMPLLGSAIDWGKQAKSETKSEDRPGTYFNKPDEPSKPFDAVPIDDSSLPF